MGSRLLCGAVLASACTAAVGTGTVEQPATVCGAGPTVNGVDVSEYDDSVEWPTAKAAGIEFAFVRVSDGLAYPDPKFAEYWAGAGAAGVLRGAYQFFEPGVDPVQQADLLLSATGPLGPGDLPPVLDLERTNGLSTAAVTAAVQTWVSTITSAIGRPPIVYAGLYSWPTLTGGADFTTSPLWIAQYTTAACPDIPAPWTSWLFWQHSDSGVVNGIVSSQLDLDVFDGTLDQLETFASGSATPCGVIAEAGGTIDDSDACFTPGGPSVTMRHVTGAGYDGALYWTHTTQAAAPVNYGEWQLSFVAGGTYRVEAYTARAYATSRAADYHIQTTTGMHSVTIDQTAVDGWQALGDIAFGSGGNQWIQLGDNTGEPTPEQLVFDAIRLTPLDGSGSNAGSDRGSSTAVGGCSTSGGMGGAASLSLVVAFACARRRRR